jgi:heavy metal sensor kinase
MALSIRWRLTIWNTSALAVVLVGFSALVYFLLAKSLYQRIDWLLLHEWRELEHDPGMTGEHHERLAYWIEEFREHEKISCVVFDSEGKVFARPQELAADSLPPLPQVESREPRFRDVALPVLGRQRQLAGPIRLGGEEYTIVLMAGLEETDHELSRLLTVLATAVPCTLVLGGVLAYGLARKALAPVGRLNRLTEAITADRLDRRLPVANPGDELGHLAQTINAMIARLQRSFAEIRRFTADASHELRTPLTAIRVETEVALQKPLAPTECHQLLGSILEECARLTCLTDQLLTLSREDARAAAPARDQVDLATVVATVVENMRTLAETKRLNLRLDLNGSMPIRGEATRLRQVFYNLLDNAIKYTPEGGTVTISGERRDGTAVVTVHDTGIGIPPEHLPRVFDRFYRVDKARSQAEGGTGLGLSIVQSILSAHGGVIQLESTVGQGTTFTVTLPLGPLRDGREGDAL